MADIERTRPTWDIATDEQILEEIDAVVAAGYTHIAFGSAVIMLLKSRGLWEEVTKRVIVGDE